MHFYVDLTLGLWIYMYLLVDRNACVYGTLHTRARIFETPLPWLNYKSRVFLNIELSVANQMSPSLSTNHMSAIRFIPALEGRGLSQCLDCCYSSLAGSCSLSSRVGESHRTVWAYGWCYEHKHEGVRCSDVWECNTLLMLCLLQWRLLKKFSGGAIFLIMINPKPQTFRQLSMCSSSQCHQVMWLQSVWRLWLNSVCELVVSS